MVYGDFIFFIQHTFLEITTNLIRITPYHNNKRNVHK